MALQMQPCNTAQSGIEYSRMNDDGQLKLRLPCLDVSVKNFHERLRPWGARQDHSSKQVARGQCHPAKN